MLAAYLPEKFGHEDVTKFLSEMAKNGFHAPHPDGTGVFLLTPSRRPVVYKTLSPAYSHTNDLSQLLKAFNPIFTILHARKGSKGGYSIENVHPFVSNNSYLFHNGTIHDKAIEYAKKELRVKNTMSNTDSELLLHIYNQHGEEVLAEFLLLHQSFYKDTNVRRMGSNVFIFDERSSVFIIYQNVLKDEFFTKDDMSVENRRYYELFSYKLEDSWIIASESPNTNEKLNVRPIISKSEIPFEEFIANHNTKIYKKGSLEVRVIKIEV